MKKQSITEAALEKLEPGSRLWDSRVRGFCARKQQRDVVFYLVYRFDGKKRWCRIGLWGSPYTVEGARREADKLLGRVANGEDPMAAKAIEREDKSAGLSLEALFREYIASQRAAGVASADEIERVLQKDFISYLGHKHPARVSDIEIEQTIDRVALRGLGAARHLLAYVRGLYNFGLRSSPALRKKYRLQTNPAELVGRGRRGRPGKYGRHGVDDRHLNDAEIPVFWRALDGSKAAESTKQMLKLLVLTGQRPSEVREADIRELHLSGEKPAWHIPKERTKNGLPHLVPLSPQAAAIFQAAIGKRERGPVFPSDETEDGFAGDFVLRQAINRMLASKTRPLKMEPFSPKDLRTTVKTGLAALRVPKEIRDACQNHKPQGVGDVHYNFHAYLDEKREAMILWANHVEKLVSKSRIASLF